MWECIICGYKDEEVLAMEIHNCKPKEESKMKEIKEGMLIKYNCGGEIIYGVTEAKTKFSDKPGWHCYWSSGNGESIPWCYEDAILESWEIIIHEPKEDIISAAQELSVQQEAANFGYQAVQGIINAHAEKNREASEDDIMLNTFSHEDLNDSYAKGYHEATMNYLDSFTFSDFDSSVDRTWKQQDFKDAVSNAALGLTGEAGEVADLIKKAIYHGRGFSNDNHPSEKAIKIGDVKDELSDVLFYVSAMAQDFGFTLEEVARHNKEKLEKRYEKGFTVEESAQKKDKLKSYDTYKGGRVL